MGSIYMGSTGAGNPIRRPSICDLTIGRFEWRETDRAAVLTPSVPEAAFVCSFPEEGRTSTVEGFSETHLTDENAKFVSFRRFAFDASDCSAVESDVMKVHLGALIGRPGRLTWGTCWKERSLWTRGMWRMADSKPANLFRRTIATVMVRFETASVMRWQRVIGWIAWKVLKFLDGGWIRKTLFSLH